MCVCDFQWLLSSRRLCCAGIFILGYGGQWTKSAAFTFIFELNYYRGVCCTTSPWGLYPFFAERGEGEAFGVMYPSWSYPPSTWDWHYGAPPLQQQQQQQQQQSQQPPPQAPPPLPLPPPLTRKQCPPPQGSLQGCGGNMSSQNYVSSQNNISSYLPGPQMQSGMSGGSGANPFGVGVSVNMPSPWSYGYDFHGYVVRVTGLHGWSCRSLKQSECLCVGYFCLESCLLRMCVCVRACVTCRPLSPLKKS